MKSEYPQLNFVEIDNWNFNVHLHTGKLIGSISCMEAGYFVFNFLEKPVGYIGAWLFHQIADKLDELNRINDAKIMEDLAKCEAQALQPEPAEETTMKPTTTEIPTTNLLADRETTHGDFPETADIAQALKTILRSSRNWDDLAAEQRESLELICTKLARIGCGNPHEQDHWKDIAGYAELVVIELENQTPKQTRDSK